MTFALSRDLMQPSYDKENDCCLTFAQNFESLLLSIKVKIWIFTTKKSSFYFQVQNLTIYEPGPAIGTYNDTESVVSFHLRNS